MMKNRVALACAALALCSTAPANATVILGGDFQVGGSFGDTGVTPGQTVSISAFYDPLQAHLDYQDARNSYHTFDAASAGLTVSVGDLVWRTTGPLTVHTWFDFDQLGRAKSVSIEFLGYTNVNQMGHGVSTLLDTPWSQDVTGYSWLLSMFNFGAADGYLANDVLSARLYTEAEINSLLAPASQQVFGATYADTRTGARNFNFVDPNYVPPVRSVPEPGIVSLLGIGMVGLLVRRRRRLA